MARLILIRGGPALVLGGVLLSGVPVWSGGATPLDQEPLPAGQMLARFATGGAPDNEVARLLASGETASDALDAFVEDVAATLDVPLFARGITSGREVVLEIERSRVLDAAAGRLRGSPQVRSVQVDRLAGPQHYWRDRLLLEPVPGSDLANAALENGERAAQSMRRQLSARLQHAHYVVATQVISPQQVELRVDLQATTLSLVKALQALAYVEYAQPNFIATIN